ncbi:hypothetical protein [Bradyrhizobium sp. LTSP885]|uniref:hypothetical protein n=1 Tax=Bradyrhizobium sp. LTSP885 TaxID=1619232 RepID=UPI000B137DFC|nr:hypothetical protein [Bradyrhizobium sp. LTSP885]
MQLLDGIGAGIFGALYSLVVADLTHGAVARHTQLHGSRDAIRCPTMVQNDAGIDASTQILMPSLDETRREQCSDNRKSVNRARERRMTHLLQPPRARSRAISVAI